MPWLILFAIVLGIGWLLFKFGRALIKPIFDWIYDLIISLFTSTGMSEKAAKALVSFIVIILILMFIIF